MPSPKNNKTILVAPLDWGLGHATRCIPVIRELQRQSCTVIVAAFGAHAALIQQEFPGVEILMLQGYGIRYGKGNLMIQLFRQLPRFLKTIKQEHQWLQQTITERKIDGVISDNRYGLYTKKVSTVFITHQLQVQAPRWLKWLEIPVQKTIYRYIQKFDTCWVPDVEDAKRSLAKQLSHPNHKPSLPVHYIGWLTRLLPQSKPISKKYKLLISLSGPEPQRTILEDILLAQLSSVTRPTMLIRGLPGDAQPPTTLLPNLSIVNHLTAPAIQEAMAECEIFLSRCGYSTLMDLQTVGCRCIFIPTPGQTEQEYLGREIARTGKAVVMQQNNFDLKEALQAAEQVSPFSTGEYRNEQLPTVISNWLLSLDNA